jgi:hypothetical protein
MNNMNLRSVEKFFPYLAAVVLFWVLSLWFFYPIVFENKELLQMDIKSGIGWGQDARQYHEQTGNYAYWSNAMFSGMPHNYTYSAPTPNIFKQIGNLLVFNHEKNCGLLFLYMLGFYILMMTLGCKNYLSVIGAIAYAFCSYNLIIIEAGHISKGLVMATMAPIISGIILCYRGKYLWGILITLIFTGLTIMWGHQQITYYLLLVIVIMAVVYLIYAIKEKTLSQYFRAFAIVLVTALLAITPSLSKLVPTMDYTAETMRGGSVLKNNIKGQKENSGLELQYAQQWSYGTAEMFTLLIPNFAGASSSYNIGKKSETYKTLLTTGQASQFVKNAPMYWAGDNYKTFTSGPVYAGSIICFLFFLGLLIVKGREKWWLLGGTVLSLMLALGRHLHIDVEWLHLHININEFFFYHLPLYNKFRTPEMALVIANLTMAILAILAVKTIIENYKQNPQKYLSAISISTIIIGGLCLFFALFGSILFDFSSNYDNEYKGFSELITALKNDRKSMLSVDAWRSLGFIVAVATLLWIYIKRAFKLNYLLIALGMLIFIDLWAVDRRFITKDTFVSKSVARKFVPSDVDKYILQDKTPNYRVLNLASNTFNESNTSYFHKSIGGYSPAKLRRYQDIIDYYLSNQINMNVLNMLNAKYVIVKTPQGIVPQLNTYALGNVWFVDTIKWVNSPDEEIVEIDKINPKTTAIIDKIWQSKMGNQVPDMLPNDTANSIKLTDYDNPGYLIYESNSDRENFAVFSEIFYKTWHAYIDGNEVPIVRANYVLRGVVVPIGKHKIEFKCVDDVYLLWRKISLICSWVVGIVLLGLFGFAIWQRVNTKK